MSFFATSISLISGFISFETGISLVGIAFFTAVDDSFLALGFLALAFISFF
jgi:hypothetical protein